MLTICSHRAGKDMLQLFYEVNSEHRKTKASSKRTVRHVGMCRVQLSSHRCLTKEVA